MRKDILVSVAIVDQEGPPATLPRLLEMTKVLHGAFQYFEIVYVVSEQVRGEIERIGGSLAALPNVRIIVTSERTRFYQQRLVAAVESIGDIVALVDLDEVELGDIPRLLTEVHEHSRVMIGWGVAKMRNRFTYRLISVISRHHVSAQVGRTIIISREALGRILTRRSAVLDLRFEPRLSPARYIQFPIKLTRRHSKRSFYRYELFLEILLFGAPRFLKAYSALGFFMTCGSLIFALYAVGVLLFKAHVQEGWFTTSMIEAGSTAFMSCGMSIIAIALVAIFERVQGGDHESVIDEISNTQFFDKMADRNIELSVQAEIAAASGGPK